MPDDWNGQLVLYMHGFEELGLSASVRARLPPLSHRPRLRVGRVELQQHVAHPRPRRR
jgi:hypothetical protein